MKRSKLVKGLGALLMVLLLAGSGAAVGFLVAKFGVEMPFVRTRLAGLSGWDLLVMPLLYLLVIGVHEGGHVLGGLSRGMRFLLFIVGPLQWSRGGSGIHFSWAFNLGTLGGVAACTPDPVRPARPQLLRLVAGGPLASLLLALLCFALATLSTGRPGAYALLTGALSLLIFSLTAVPMRAGGFMSDGMQFVELLRGGRGVEERNVLMALMAQSLAGVRPAQLDQRLLKEALAFADPEPLRKVAARLYAFLHAWDAGQLDVAAEHRTWLGEHIRDYPDGFRQSLAIELALFAALEDSDQVRAREWLRQGRGGVVDASRRALAEVAVACLEDQLETAAASLQVAHHALPRGIDRGLAVFSADQIQVIQSKLCTPSSAVTMSQLSVEAVK